MPAYARPSPLCLVQCKKVLWYDGGLTKSKVNLGFEKFVVINPRNIALILVDLRRQLHEQVSLFSGVDFTVDNAKGLNGSDDFIITKSPEILIFKAPVITVVEVKKENINAGLGQCAAQMVAAQIFHEQATTEIKAIYGAVTTGSIWQFLKLEEQTLSIDLSEYYLKDVNRIIGILASGIFQED